jgi:hypothetical protein
MMNLSEYFKAHPCGSFIFALIVCSVVGWGVVGCSLVAIRSWLRLKTEGSLYDPGVFLLGSTERLVATALVVWAPAYLAGFIGGWILLKFALGWRASWQAITNRSTPSRLKLQPDHSRLQQDRASIQRAR